jgi:ABC-type multidrug transport system ATPase subunit
LVSGQVSPFIYELDGAEGLAIDFASGAAYVCEDAGERITSANLDTGEIRDLTPYENVRFSASLYGLADPDRRAREALDAMGLSARRDDPVRTLSRGLQQRAALARTLVHGPRLLLLDEPTTGLDRDAAARIVEAVRGAVRAGAAAVVATHDVEAGLAASPRWIVLERGRVVASGDATRGERP